MSLKFTVGQFIKIIEAKDQHLHVKYPELQQYVGQTATILDYYVFPLKGLKGTRLEGLSNTYYCYKVQLSDGTELPAVMEDALEPLTR